MILIDSNDNEYINYMEPNQHRNNRLENRGNKTIYHVNT